MTSNYNKREESKTKWERCEKTANRKKTRGATKPKIIKSDYPCATPVGLLIPDNQDCSESSHSVVDAVLDDLKSDHGNSGFNQFKLPYW